jgi:hypothetical protein
MDSRRYSVIMPHVISPAKPRQDGLKVTREEYLDLEEDGFLYDMIDGVLYMSPSPFVEHNDVLSEILRAILCYFSGFPDAYGAKRVWYFRRFLNGFFLFQEKNSKVHFISN